MSSRARQDLPEISCAWTRSIAGVYLHVPFCASDCAYCAFAREVPASRDAVGSYLDGLERETRYFAERLGGKLLPRTLYIGGGTPTFLTPVEWDRLEAAVLVLVDPSALEEVTVEANPESTTPVRLDRLRAFGMTRLSLGAQAFAAPTLAMLDRTHDWDRVATAVSLARRDAGLVVSLDLIYGIPGLTDSMWSRTLDEALALSPDHLSAYCLSYEEGSSLAKRRAAGLLEGQSDDMQRAAYDLLVARAEGAGLHRYEVSNFGTGRGRSRHNLGYWEGRDYLGLGPSAHSHVAPWRFRNHTRREAWQVALASGSAPIAAAELLGERERAAERLMRLRVSSGVPCTQLPDPGGAFWTRVQVLADAGLVCVVTREGAEVPSVHPGGEGTRLCLTRGAFFVSDGVVADLLAAWDEEMAASRAAGSGGGGS